MKDGFNWSRLNCFELCSVPHRGRWRIEALVEAAGSPTIDPDLQALRNKTWQVVKIHLTSSTGFARCVHSSTSPSNECLGVSQTGKTMAVQMLARTHLCFSLGVVHQVAPRLNTDQTWLSFPGPRSRPRPESGSGNISEDSLAKVFRVQMNQILEIWLSQAMTGTFHTSR